MRASVLDVVEYSCYEFLLCDFFENTQRSAALQNLARVQDFASFLKQDPSPAISPQTNALLVTTKNGDRVNRH